MVPPALSAPALSAVSLLTTTCVESTLQVRRLVRPLFERLPKDGDSNSVWRSCWQRLLGLKAVLRPDGCLWPGSRASCSRPLLVMESVCWPVRWLDSQREEL